MPKPSLNGELDLTGAEWTCTRLPPVFLILGPPNLKLARSCGWGTLTRLDTSSQRLNKLCLCRIVQAELSLVKLKRLKSGTN